MSEGEIDYRVLIDHSIKDFQPAAKLWPLGVRLVLWIFFELSLLTLCASVNGLRGVASLIQMGGILIEAGVFILASVAAALLALRSAIPAREPARSELLLVIAGVCVAFVVGALQPSAALSLIHDADLHWLLQTLGLSILPWTALFWAVARGVPLEPFETGGLVGIASFCFGIATDRLISGANGSTSPLIWQATFGIILTTGSALAGAHFLNPERRWHGTSGLVGAPSTTLAFFSRPALVPLAIGGSIAALFLVLSNAGKPTTRIPDFDLAIAKYERAIANFTPNVPSRDIETMLTAYVENGMPTYMWDFSRQGFKFVGGRFEHLPDGAAVTYTWFLGAKNGVMCMFRQTDSFRAPPGAHEERQHLHFYRYRGFSVCLINVGGYGSFLSVIVAPMSMDRFKPLVLAATA
jgi:Negative regulator of sigma F